MNDTKTKCFVDCEELQENTAKFNFEDNTLKLGKASLSNLQLKRISLMFATDLKNLAESRWQNPKSNRKRSLFSLAKQSIKQPREEVEKYFFFFLLQVFHLFTKYGIICSYYKGENMSVLSYLEKLEKDLRLSQSEKDSIETSISTLKTRLNNYFGDDISEILIFGSYKRNTNLCRKSDESSDVDVMVVFKDFGYKPQTYIDKLKRFMEIKYSNSEIYQSYPCAILELHHIKFELTPAIWYYSKTYKIPNNENYYLDWINTTPFYLDELAAEKLEMRYKQVSRLVKYWNCLNKKHFASYKLEEQVFNSGIYCYADNLQQNLFQVLKDISPYGEPQYVKDYIQKTIDIIKFIEENETNYPLTSENKIKTLFKELN